MQFAEFIEHLRSHLQFVLAQPVVEYLLASLLQFAVVAAQYRHNLLFRLRRENEVYPRSLHVLRLRREYLHLVAALQLVAQRHQFVVHLSADTVRTEERMYLESEVERRTLRRHGLDFALRCEHEYLACEEVKLDGIEEVHCVGLRVVENLLDSRQPVVEFRIFINGLYARLQSLLLVLPVSGKALLSHFVHMVGTYLHLYPLALLRHQRHVQSLIAVCLRVVHPVAQTVGVRLVYAVDCDVYLEALVDFLRAFLRRIDDAHSKNVVDFVERDVLVLHLVPNGIRTLHARLQFVLYAHLVESFTYRSSEVLEKHVALRLRVGKFSLDIVVLFWMLVAEREVFEFSFYLVQAQAVCEWSVDVERLTGNLILLVSRLRLQSAHVVQAVANLDEYDTDVIAHREQQLLEVFCLRRRLVAEDTTRNLGQSVHNLRNLLAEDIRDILNSIVGILDNIVQECGADARRPESHLLHCDACHRNRVHDVWFARQSAHTFVCLSCEVECLGYNINLLSVTRCHIYIEYFLEGLFYHLVISRLSLLVFQILVVHDSGLLYINKVYVYAAGCRDSHQSYLMRIFLPARMLLPLILLSFFSFLTVVPLRRAISESVSPWRIVTFLLRSRRDFLRDALLCLPLLLEEWRDTTGASVFIATSRRFVSSSSGL